MNNEPLANEPLADDPNGAAPDGRDLLVRWNEREAMVLDVVALVLATVLAVCVIGDLDLPGRPALALVTFLFAPGWSVLRAFGAPAASLTLFAAFGLSIAITILTGQLLVTLLDWAWRPASATVLIATAVLVGVRFARRSAHR